MKTEDDERVDVVLRSLRGEVLADLARETGRPRKQLSSWRTRFLAGGRAALDGHDPAEGEAARERATELATRVDQLEADNLVLDRQLALLRSSRAHPDHPLASLRYARALEEPGVAVVPVPPWGTSVLVRETTAGRRQATGLRPIAPLAPDADLVAGMTLLAEAGVDAVSLVTDPLWAPEVPSLEAAFDACRPFKVSYFVDRRAGGVSARKRHRNLVNRARRVTEVRTVDLADTLDRWLEVYAGNVAAREITQPFPRSYFEALVDVPGLSTVVVMLDGEIVTITLWIRHGDILYYHDGASSEAGYACAASYAAFAHVIEGSTSCRFIVLGGSSHFQDDPQDGLAVFKRGFANASAMSHLCRANLARRASLTG